MTNIPTVYVIKEQQIRTDSGSVPMDYSKAFTFGEVKFITRTDLPTYPGSDVRANWEKDVARFVEAYDESRDYIIPTGQPVAIFAVGHALGVAAKTPRFLVWRREEGAYQVMGNKV